MCSSEIIETVAADVEWRVVPSWPNYEASVDGRIRNIKTGHLLKPMESKSGHLYFFPRRSKRLYFHRAILEAFVCPAPDGCEARHLDGDPQNNHLSNLAWGSRLQNAMDKRRHGSQPIGERSGSAKLTEKDVREIRNHRGRTTLRKLASNYGVSHTSIRRAAVGISWRHIE